MKKLLVLLAWLCLGGTGLRAQGEFVQVDGIAAVVGTVSIPLTRIDEEINILRQSGATIPTDPEALRNTRMRVLNNLIEEELLVQAALRDTAVSISEEQVTSAVDESIRSVREQYLTEFEYNNALRESGFASPEEYRAWLSNRQRRALLRDAYLQSLRERGELEPIPPSDEELEDFFRLMQPEQRQRPATVSFRQIVIMPQADSIAWVAARARADSVYQILLEEGTDDGLVDRFADAARRYSDEPGAAETGGDLGWFRRGAMVREFEAVAFRLRPGVFSPPIRTPFGYHIIMVERIQPAERKARHILFSPRITEQDRQRARDLAESIADTLQSIDDPMRATVLFDSLAKRYHDPDQQAIAESVTRSDLPAIYQQALESGSPGDILGPVYVDLGDGRPYHAVIRFDREREAGEYTIDDVRDQLSSRLGRDLALRRLIDNLRDKTYISIRI